MMDVWRLGKLRFRPGPRNDFACLYENDFVELRSEKLANDQPCRPAAANDSHASHELRASGCERIKRRSRLVGSSTSASSQLNCDRLTSSKDERPPFSRTQYTREAQ